MDLVWPWNPNASFNPWTNLKFWGRKVVGTAKVTQDIVVRTGQKCGQVTVEVAKASWTGIVATGGGLIDLGEWGLGLVGSISKELWEALMGGGPIQFSKDGFRYSGKWAGPGWAGGEWIPGNIYHLTPREECDLKKPDDACDDCAKKHDYCYDSCKLKYPHSSFKQALCRSKCDLKLTACLLYNQDLKSSFRIRRYLMVPVFAVKAIGNPLWPGNWFSKSDESKSK